MIKIFFLFLSIIFMFENSWAGKKPRSQTGSEAGIEFRAIKKWQRYLFLFETKNREEILGTNYHQLMVGSYLRHTKRLRSGLFFQGEKGLRWDNDWRKEGSAWKWQDIGSRWDFSTVFDNTFNDQLSSNWVWEFKNRLFYYHSRAALQLRVRPGLRYFILEHGQPLWQIYSEVEGYIPLNYGKKTLYEYWLYLGALYQWNPRFSLGPVMAYRTRWFHSYEGFKDRTREQFKATFQSTYLGLNAVYLW